MRPFLLPLFLVLVLLLTVSCNLDGYFSRDDRIAMRGEKAVALQEQAEQGEIDAQALLGFKYFKGNDVEQDYEKAYEWFRKAAEQGSAFAQLGLGTMYAEGSGVQKDSAQAAMWYEKAAEQGSVGCQYRLGAMYREGRGVAQCYVQAYKWLSLAAMKNVTKASTLRDKIAGEMTSDQIAEAEKLLQNWMKKHGE